MTGIWGLNATASSGASFDYYVSPTGNDSSAGTLAAPWAITSLSRLTQNANNVANHALIAGKRVGLLPGVYPVYSLWTSATYEDPALTIPAGTSGSPTYIGASNSSGFYVAPVVGTPSQVQITASPSGTPGGGLPDTSGGSSIAIVGQYYGSAQGYMTLDGVRISDGTGYGFAVFGGGNAGTVQNCEIYNGNGSEGNNPAALMLSSGPTNWTIHNNKIHDWQISGGGNHNCAGFFTLSPNSGHVYTNNTVYNVNSCVYHKNGEWSNITHAYGYYENNGSNPEGVFVDSGSGELNGAMTIHHCIFVAAGGNPVINGEAETVSNTYTPYQSMVFYNNTIWMLGAPQTSLFWQAAGTGVSPTASVTHYNNIWTGAAASGGGYNIMYGSASGAIALSDYNGYPGTTTPTFSVGSGSLFSPTTTYSGLAAVGSALSVETHSYAQSSTSGVFSNPGVAVTPSGYTLASGSPAKSAGTTTGLSSGTACDQGAYGYDPATGFPNPTVGCNF
jgi:hypothetical protein